MKLSTYRILDLIMLLVLGIFGEAIGTYIVSISLPINTPYCVVGMIVVIVAITRWKHYGLILIPFMSLANFITGKFFLVDSASIYYTGFRYLYTTLSYIPVLLCFKFYQKNTPTSIFKHFGSNVSIATAISVLQWVILYVGNVLEVELIYSEGESVILARLAQFANVGFGIVFSYLLIIIFGFIFSSQNVLVDVKQNLIDTKKEKEAEREYYSNLINPIDETQKSSDSSDGKDCDHDGRE